VLFPLFEKQASFSEILLFPPPPCDAGETPFFQDPPVRELGRHPSDLVLYRPFPSFLFHCLFLPLAYRNCFFGKPLELLVYTPAEEDFPPKNKRVSGKAVTISSSPCPPFLERSLFPPHDAKASSPPLLRSKGFLSSQIQTWRTLFPSLAASS